MRMILMSAGSRLFQNLLCQLQKKFAVWERTRIIINRNEDDEDECFLITFNFSITCSQIWCLFNHSQSKIHRIWLQTIPPMSLSSDNSMIIGDFSNYWFHFLPVIYKTFYKKQSQVIDNLMRKAGVSKERI